MTLSDLAALGSVVSGVAVLVSLIFLYFQMKQLTAQVKIAEKSSSSLVIQGRTERTVGMNLQLAGDPDLERAVEKGFAGHADLTPEQFGQFRRYNLAMFLNMEEAYLQHRTGLATGDAFARLERNARVLFSAPGMRALWKSSHRRFDEDYATFVDRIIAETEAEPPGDAFAQWKAALAAEAATKGRPA